MPPAQGFLTVKIAVFRRFGLARAGPELHAAVARGVTPNGAGRAWLRGRVRRGQARSGALDERLQVEHFLDVRHQHELHAPVLLAVDISGIAAHRVGIPIAGRM